MGHDSSQATLTIRAAYIDSPERGLKLIERPSAPLNFRLSAPSGGHVGLRQAFATYFGVPGAKVVDLGAVPLGAEGQRVLALRYIIANGEAWLRHFAWTEPLRGTFRTELEAQGVHGAELERQLELRLAQVSELVARLSQLRASIAEAPAPDEQWLAALFDPSGPLGTSPLNEAALGILVTLEVFPALRERAREELRRRAGDLFERAPRTLDTVYLASYELTRFPATTVSAGQLKYVIVADKGEMGVRAVREAVRLGRVPVVLYSLQDDANSLQVRLAKRHAGILVGLTGSFRESYANYLQIAERVHQTFQERFGESWEAELARAALYPGYGPLAENTAAIGHFRRSGIVFIGPSEDVVANIGDKRNFRLLSQKLDPAAVTPGIVIDSSSKDTILELVERGLEQGKFALPGRLKAANGGGGRGQAIVTAKSEIAGAIDKVLGEIQAFNWDPGVMFEQNIADTIHLEVQVLRDRYGNTRHFGMRDCSEQRASQKIQEEAPPALLAKRPELRQHIEELAVRIIDSVGYVGAATVELMYKEGKFYFLETNTRIQVEHPVSEASHRILRGGQLHPLNLVELQIQVANGRPLDFEQEQVVATHVAREFRINAEAWNGELKDSRDGRIGLFVPNGGIFDRIEVPDAADVLGALEEREQIEDLQVRFDCGFEAGDLLVNKDPTFGKLIVALRAPNAAEPYELLRKASLEVLRRTRIEGRQAMPNGTIINRRPLQTNVADHLRILELPVLLRHSRGDEQGRHVNWVLSTFRAASAKTPKTS